MSGPSPHHHERSERARDLEEPKLTFVKGARANATAEESAKVRFEVTTFNGRALGDDVLDVMLTLAANMPIVDGLAPDRGRIRKDFPYYGSPYTAEEQVGVTPRPRPAKK